MSPGGSWPFPPLLHLTQPAGSRR
ncbi:uncharacterized protein METZ01_LOCUS460085, partial [marine metagenome]